MDLSHLQAVLKKEPAYRFKQVKQALFKDLITDWGQAQNLPKTLRQKLTEKCLLDSGEKIITIKDGGAVKALITLADGLKIESVLLFHRDGRCTVCVSSQVGCPLACRFCATGKMGFKRNLEAEEIVSQVLFFARYLKKTGKKITNIVLMGMGEPFLNYDNVISAIKILNDHDGFNLGARNFSLSTVGIISGIKKLAQEKLQVNLAISLHAPENQLRLKIIPINKKYPIEKILAAVDDYIKKTRRRVMFEYLLIKGINDSDNQAEKLAALLNQPLYFINLIVYNPTGDFEPSPPRQVKKFKAILEKAGVPTTLRYSFGGEITGACGQLGAKVYGGETCQS